MNTIRIRASKLATAAKVAQGMGLIIDQVNGDQDKEYVNIGARHAGPWGNHAPRWTEEQREEFLNWKL